MFVIWSYSAAAANVSTDLQFRVHTPVALTSASSLCSDSGRYQLVNSLLINRKYSRIRSRATARKTMTPNSQNDRMLRIANRARAVSWWRHVVMAANRCFSVGVIVAMMMFAYTLQSGAAVRLRTRSRWQGTNGSMQLDTNNHCFNNMITANSPIVWRFAISSRGITWLAIWPNILPLSLLYAVLILQATLISLLLTMNVNYCVLYEIQTLRFRS